MVKKNYESEDAFSKRYVSGKMKEKSSLLIGLEEDKEQLDSKNTNKLIDANSLNEFVDNRTSIDFKKEDEGKKKREEENKDIIFLKKTPDNIKVKDSPTKVQTENKNDLNINKKKRKVKSSLELKNSLKFLQVKKSKNFIVDQDDRGKYKKLSKTSIYKNSSGLLSMNRKTAKHSKSKHLDNKKPDKNDFNKNKKNKNTKSRVYNSFVGNKKLKHNPDMKIHLENIFGSFKKNELRTKKKTNLK